MGDKTVISRYFAHVYLKGAMPPGMRVDRKPKASLRTSPVTPLRVERPKAKAKGARSPLADPRNAFNVGPVGDKVELQGS